MGAKPLLTATALVLLAGVAAAQPEQTADTVEGTLIIAQARWPGQDLSHANFYVFADAQMKDRVDVFPSGGPGGAAFMALRPGSYYIMVVVDVNANGQTDAGDGFGWYGVEDLAPSSRPQPLKVGDTPGEAITIPILLTRTEAGGLAPLPDAPRGRGTVTGLLTGFSGQAWVVLRADPQARSFPVALVAPDGAFEIIAQGDSYELLACAKWGEDADLCWRRPADEVRIEADQTTELGELAGEGEAVSDAPAVLAGVVTGARPPEGSAIHVQVCADATMRGELAALRASSSGLFVMALQPATYYLRAIVGADTRPGPGDELGFFGVADLTGEDRPQPVPLAFGQVRADLLIPIVARIAQDGSIEAVTAADTTAGNGTGE